MSKKPGQICSRVVAVLLAAAVGAAQPHTLGFLRNGFLWTLSFSLKSQLLFVLRSSEHHLGEGAVGAPMDSALHEIVLPKTSEVLQNIFRMLSNK